MKLIILVAIILNSFFSFTQTQIKCSFVIVDKDSRKEITECHIYSRTSELKRDSKGGFVMDCNPDDSLLIIASGYEYQFTQCNNSCDTVFLQTNQIELEEVTISGEKKKSKSFYFGSRKQKLDSKTAYGFDVFRNQKMITIFPNNSMKSLTIEEAYVFIEKIDTVKPNLLIAFSENDNGQLGTEIANSITVYDQNKKSGWFRLNLNNRKIKIPENGMMITIENYNLKPNILYLGMNEYKENLNIKTFTIVNNSWYELPLTSGGSEGEERKHYGVKFYFKVKL